MEQITTNETTVIGLLNTQVETVIAERDTAQHKLEVAMKMIEESRAAYAPIIRAVITDLSFSENVEQITNEVIENIDFSRIVERELNDQNMTGAIADAINDYDFSDIVCNELDNINFNNFRNFTNSIEEVLDNAQCSIDFGANIHTLIGEYLEDNAGEQHIIRILNKALNGEPLSEATVVSQEQRITKLEEQIAVQDKIINEMLTVMSGMHNSLNTLNRTM